MARSRLMRQTCEGTRQCLFSNATGVWRARIFLMRAGAACGPVQMRGIPARGGAQTSPSVMPMRPVSMTSAADCHKQLLVNLRGGKNHLRRISSAC